MLNLDAMKVGRELFDYRSGPDIVNSNLEIIGNESNGRENSRHVLVVGQSMESSASPCDQRWR